MGAARIGAAGLVALLATGCWADGSKPKADPAKVVAKAKSFKQYRLYFAGGSFGKLPLTDVVGEDTRTGPVTFVYGSCKPGPDAGCAPPVQVQTWSICKRHYKTISPPRGAITRVRGVPAAEYRADGRLEVYSGDVNVVLFTRSIGEAKRVARSLRSLDGRVGPREPLPPPVEGAVSGRPAGCGSRSTPPRAKNAVPSTLSLMTSRHCHPCGGSGKRPSPFARGSPTAASGGLEVGGPAVRPAVQSDQDKAGGFQDQEQEPGQRRGAHARRAPRWSAQRVGLVQPDRSRVPD